MVVRGRREIAGEDVGRVAEAQGVEGLAEAEGQVEGVGEGWGDH